MQIGDEHADDVHFQLNVVADVESTIAVHASHGAVARHDFDYYCWR